MTKVHLLILENYQYSIELINRPSTVIKTRKLVSLQYQWLNSKLYSYFVSCTRRKFWIMSYTCHVSLDLETNPIAIKPETASQVAELYSWVPLPYCSPPGCPFPIKSLALSAHVSPRTIHFRVLDKSPVSGLGKGPPSCNTYICTSTCKIVRGKLLTV